MVFILFGVSKHTHVAGLYNMFCSNCKANMVHTAYLDKQAFTVFFIPMLPLGSSRRLVCNRCAFSQASWEMVKHPYAVPVGMMAARPPEEKPKPKPVHIEMPPYPPAPPSRREIAPLNPTPAVLERCPHCGAELTSVDKFCGSCGGAV